MIDQKRKKLVKEIYERQIDRAYRIALLCTGDPHDAEDVTESVFLTVIEKGITFESEEHEKAWFITSVRNRCKDLYKSAWRGKVQLEELAERDDACTDMETEAESEAAGILMMLPDDQRDAVYLCYYEGYTVREAAEIMEMKETGVRSALAAAKRRIRRKSDELR